MTNKEEGLELINLASKIFERDVINSLKDNDYNLVVRRSQESVELALKGVLKLLGIEYPKVHDVGDIFEKRLKEKGVKIKNEVCKKVKKISLWLAEAREPSFYFEKKFTRKDAMKAKEDAKFVIQEIKKFFLP